MATKGKVGLGTPLKRRRVLKARLYQANEIKDLKQDHRISQKAIQSRKVRSKLDNVH